MFIINLQKAVIILLNFYLLLLSPQFTISISGGGLIEKKIRLTINVYNNLNKMKYILIGGSGFIGQHFTKILKNDIIANLDIDSGINNSNFTYCNILKKNDLDNITISSEEEVTLIHLAAVHFDFQKKFFKTNVDGTRNILNFITKHQNIKKFVFFSSVATYGNSRFGKNESSDQIPVNDYGKSKLEAEKLIFNSLNLAWMIVSPTGS